jgi:hypothetical protein
VVFFNEHLQTHDIFKNPIFASRTIGRYQLPHIVPIVGYDPNQVQDPNNPAQLGPQAMGAQIESTATIYEFEFEKLKPWLIDQRSKGLIDDNCQFYAWVGQRKYTRLGFLHKL